MALTITAASVIATVPARCKSITLAAGVTVTQGQLIAADATGKAVLCDADSGTLLSTQPIGIATSAGSPGQRITYTDSDDTFTIGATVLAGVPYFSSATAGAIEPLTAQAATYAALVGYGINTTQIKLALSYSGVLNVDPTP
jgi:hypothetical protein